LKLVVFFAAILLPAAAFGLEIYAAPLFYVDETADFKRDAEKVQTDLLSALWSAETGAVLNFKRLKDNSINPPVSLTDAVTVCRNEQIEYLLYGYVTRREYSVQAEVRLFDYAGRKVAQSFFGMDDNMNYDRLINDMAMKILAYIGETFKLEIISEKIQMARFEIPVTAGYWTPMDSGWVEVMFGTVMSGSGLEFIPTDNLFVFKGKTCYLSTGIDIKYRLGVGNPSRYEAYNHTLYITTPVRLNVLLTRRHEVFAGLGFVYFLEFFAMVDKYDESRVYIFNNTGLNVGFGYRFVINQKLSVFFRNDFDFLFNERSLITYAPVIGMNINIYEQEIRKKW
jgi:hypothetical protein